MRQTQEPKPISIPDELAARCTGPDQFERFDKLFRAVIAVPHEQIVKEEKKWKRARATRRDDK
ncbi:MAG: hypothetical protein JO340_04600 [Acidobacteriaceae bacterium]|nr:hypothetical protein [Acidobacteriaceae bacterium]